MLFSFPSRYWFTIDQNVYLVLPDSPGRFLQDFTSPVVLKNTYRDSSNAFRIQDFHLLWYCFPSVFTTHRTNHPSVEADEHKYLTTPSIATPSSFQYHSYKNRNSHTYNTFTIEVWTVPVSLAATQGIDSFFDPT